MTDFDENSYKEIIDSALKTVKQELLIQIGNEKYLVFIHDLTAKGNQIFIDWSTPYEEEREMLLPHVEAAIKAQIDQNKKKPWWVRLFKRKEG